MEYFAFQWHITDSCDQRCEHCYIFSEGHPHIIEMPLDKAEEVIGQCAEMCRQINRLPYFYITGGDPILHRNFWEILSLLKERDIPFTILGNPFHITDEVCQRLKSKGCQKYQLSIDGMRDTHDAIRKPGSFDSTVEKIDVLSRNGIRVAVMTTVSGTNINEIPDIVDLVVEKGVHVFAFGRYCPTSEEKSTHISPMEYRDFLGRIWEKFEQHKDSGTIFNLKDHLWTLFYMRRDYSGYLLRVIPMQSMTAATAETVTSPFSQTAMLWHADGLKAWSATFSKSQSMSYGQVMRWTTTGNMTSLRNAPNANC